MLQEPADGKLCIEGAMRLITTASLSQWLCAQKSSPTPSPTSTNASTHTVQTVLIATLVPTCVIAIALVWFLLVRNTRVHRDMLGRVIAPPVAPDTTMLVAVVQVRCVA